MKIGISIDGKSVIDIELGVTSSDRQLVADLVAAGRIERFLDLLDAAIERVRTDRGAARVEGVAQTAQQVEAAVSDAETAATTEDAPELEPLPAGFDPAKTAALLRGMSPHPRVTLGGCFDWSDTKDPDIWVDEFAALKAGMPLSNAARRHLEAWLAMSQRESGEKTSIPHEVLPPLEVLEGAAPPPGFLRDSAQRVFNALLNNQERADALREAFYFKSTVEGWDYWHEQVIGLLQGRPMGAEPAATLRRWIDTTAPGTAARVDIRVGDVWRAKHGDSFTKSDSRETLFVLDVDEEKVMVQRSAHSPVRKLMRRLFDTGEYALLFRAED